MAFPTTPVLDDFNRANENPLDNGTWTIPSGAQIMRIISNAAVPTAVAGASVAYWSVGAFGPASEVYSTVTVLPGSTNYTPSTATITQLVDRLQDLP